MRHRGYTLAEAMMAVVVLSAAAAGVLLPYSRGAAVQSEGMRRTLAAKLAADLTQQILDTPADQIVSAYDGYSEPQGQVRGASGTVFTDSNYAKFSRDVSCQYVYVPQESGTTAPQFIRITVRVYYEGRLIAAINRLVSQ